MIRFDDLRLTGDPNNPRRLEQSTIYDILFDFQGNTGEAFDLLVNDLSFIDKSSSLCR